MKRLLVPRSHFGFDLHDLGNDFARFLDDDMVADADILSLDFLVVMEAGAGDRRAREMNRFEVGDRRQLARLADLHIDRQKFGNRLFGGILVRDLPTRGFAGRAELFSLREIDDFDHHAIDLIREAVPFARPLVDVLKQLLQIVKRFDVRDDRQTEAFQQLKGLYLIIDFIESLFITDRVYEDSQRAAGDDFGVEHLSVPAAALRGLAKVVSPSSSRASLMAAKSFLEK